MSSTHDPYLSIVVTSRNDDHGGELLRRMQIFIDGILIQCKRHELRAELIIVEWNAPLDRPRLAESLSWAHSNRFCPVRIIDVPHEIHKRFKHSDKLNLYQMIAKNVGIRRAKGKFILATNIDLLFPDGLIKFLAAEKLQAGVSYRVDRYDVPSGIPVQQGLDRQLQFCSDNVLRIAARHGNIEKSLSWSGCTQILKALKTLLKNAYKKWIKQVILNAKGRDLSVESLRKFKLPGFDVIRFAAPVHTNACGDFTLLSKDDWFRLKGYPELKMYSLHIDSLFCYIAYFSGITEEFLTYPIYHLEHLSGWTPKAERDKTIYQPLKTKGIPWLSPRHIEAWNSQMWDFGAVDSLNDHRWGVRDETFQESVISGEG